MQKLYYSKGPFALVNFELDEEERDRDAMRLLVYKNKDHFTFLFKKYSAQG